MKEVFLLQYGTSKGKAALGTLFVREGREVIFTAPTIENNVKRFPPGTYPIVLEYSPAFKMDLWEIKDIPGRSECKIHVANYWHQLKGCIAPGLEHKDINGDGVLDVATSSKTIDKFHFAMAGIKKTTITVIEV